MSATARTADGLFVVDLERRCCSIWPRRDPRPSQVRRSRAARRRRGRAGSTDRRGRGTAPPLACLHDAGRTWRESGGGLPAGSAVAIDADDPDLVLYAARNRLYLSRDGGRFWRALAPELPAIQRGRALEPELAARDDDRRAADLDPLDLIGAPSTRA